MLLDLVRRSGAQVLKLAEGVSDELAARLLDVRSDWKTVELNAGGKEVAQWLFRYWAEEQHPFTTPSDAKLQILQLADVETPLVTQLTGMDPDFPELSGTAPTEETAASTVLEKVLVMQAAGLPQEAIVQAVGRALDKDRASSQAYLQALAVLHAFFADTWLKKVMGIGTEPAPDVSQS